MNTHIIKITIVAALLANTAFGQDTLTAYRSHTTKAFMPGEKLNYVLHYGIFDGGRASIEVKKSPKKFNGREAWHMVGKGWSVGALDWFFKVRDTYQTYMDVHGMFPWEFVRDINEGGYKMHQDYKFIPLQKKVDTHRKITFDLKQPFAQDMLSAFYYARTLNYDTAKVGDVFVIHSFVDEEEFPLKIRYLGKETITIRSGKYNCLKFGPVVQQGRVFETDDDLNVWITDDKNRIPILAETKLVFGSIKMELTGFEGLANPIARIKY